LQPLRDGVNQQPFQQRRIAIDHFGAYYPEASFHFRAQRARPLLHFRA
jgi:hypothetical protein